MRFERCQLDGPLSPSSAAARNISEARRPRATSNSKSCILATAGLWRDHDLNVTIQSVEKGNEAFYRETIESAGKEIRDLWLTSTKDASRF